MPAQHKPCPFHPKQMVITIGIIVCTRETGVGVMEMLTPEERIRIFRAVEWYRDNPDWDHFTYLEPCPEKEPGKGRTNDQN